MKLSRASILNWDVLVITKHGCPYCAQLKHDLNALGVVFKEHELNGASVTYAQDKQHIVQLTGHTTFPQLFVKGKLIGGHAEFQKLMRQGRLPFQTTCDP